MFFDEPKGRVSAEKPSGQFLAPCRKNRLIPAAAPYITPVDSIPVKAHGARACRYEYRHGGVCGKSASTGPPLEKPKKRGRMLSPATRPFFAHAQCKGFTAHIQMRKLLPETHKTFIRRAFKANAGFVGAVTSQAEPKPLAALLHPEEPALTRLQLAAKFNAVRYRRNGVFGHAAAFLLYFMSYVGQPVCLFCFQRRFPRYDKTLPQDQNRLLPLLAIIVHDLQRAIVYPD
jgi:hypothetical protein